MNSIIFSEDIFLYNNKIKKLIYDYKIDIFCPCCKSSFKILTHWLKIEFQCNNCMNIKIVYNGTILSYMEYNFAVNNINYNLISSYEENCTFIEFTNYDGIKIYSIQKFDWSDLKIVESQIRSMVLFND